MTFAQVATHLVAARNTYIATAVAVTISLTALALAKVPAKLDAHMAQADTIKFEQRWTNRKLDVLICLQAKLDTPIRCVAQGK